MTSSEKTVQVRLRNSLKDLQIEHQQLKVSSDLILLLFFAYHNNKKSDILLFAFIKMNKIWCVMFV